MTREKWKQMTPDQQERKIAKLLGWSNIERYRDVADRKGAHSFLAGLPPDVIIGGMTTIPDHLNDTKATEVAVAELTSIQFCKYVMILAGHTTPGEKIQWCGEDAGRVARATAAQRCEALALTLEPE